MSIRRSLILLAASLLSACGGGDSVPGERPAAVVSGNAVDALIINGDVSVYSFATGSKGELLGTGTTDNTGAYSVSIQAPSQPVLVEITNGSYTEEASGVTVSLKPGQKVAAVTYFESGSPVTVMVTPWTYVAVGYAVYKISHGTNVGNAITEANTAISNWMGVDILATYPRNVTDPSNLAMQMSDELLYGYFAAGVSGWTEWASGQNGQSVHTLYTSIALSQLLYRDVVSDGKLDGVEGGQPLAFGAIPLDANVYRSGFAAQMLGLAADSGVNKAGMVVSDLLADAQSIASSNHPIFGGLSPIPLDDTAPVIAANEAAGLWKTGTFNYSVSVTDFVGVQQVDFYLDGTRIGTAVNASAPAVNINSALYADGPHTIGVVATDSVGNTTALTTFAVNFDNTGAVAVVTSGLVTNKASYPISGTWSDNGPGVASIKVNGISMAINSDGTWSGVVALVPGTQAATLVVTDSVGISASYDLTLSLDQAPPSVTTTLYSNYVTYAVDAVTTYQDTFAFADQLMYPLLVATDKIAASGVPYYDLERNGFPVVTWQVADPSYVGVQTPADQLTVEARYTKGGMIARDWHPATLYTALASGSTYYMSPIEELLGTGWSDTTSGETHLYELRITDEAGNETIVTFKFKADVRPAAPAVAASGVNPFSSFVFSDRTTVYGSDVLTASYTFENTTSVPVFASPTALRSSTLSRSIDDVIRVNKARLINTREWRARAVSMPTLCNFVYGAWQPITTTGYYAGVPSQGWTTLNLPAPTFGTVQNVTSDSPTPPSATAWANKNIAITTYTQWGTGRYYSLPIDAANHIYAAVSNVVFPASALGPCVAQSFQERVVYSYVNELGYPTNNVTTWSEGYTLGSESYRVFDSGNVEQMPVNGWYKFQPGQIYTIEKFEPVPSLPIYNDTAVGNLSTFSSYVTMQYTKSIDLTTDSSLSLILVNATNPLAISSRTQVTYPVAGTQATYGLSR